MLKRLIPALFGCLLALSSLPAAAYEFAPIVAQFTPNGSGAARTFVVRNTHEEPVALQIEMFQRSADETGKELRQPEYDDFIITPPQLVLAPGQSQSIRVQWVGDSDPDMELSYRMIVEQLPIPYAKEDAGSNRVTDISLGIRYEAALYVVPREGDPAAEITQAESIETETGEKILRLTIKNTGQRRAILQEPSVTVTTNGQSTTLSGDSIPVLSNYNIIAGTQAVFDIPWPESVPFGPVSASLSTDYYKN